MERFRKANFRDAAGLTLLVALSGGADSVALLRLLCEARQALTLTLIAVHVDHCIRGEVSHEDAAFCRSLCEELNVPIFVETADVPALRLPGEGLETAARRIRYAALERVYKQTNADRIALAHHLDDQSETVLMHLLRGCGPDGIAGMARDDGHLYRPLLDVSKRDLENYLLSIGQSWREDATNKIADNPRNALRLHGLPALEKAYPQAVRAIARYGEAAATDNRFLNRLAEDFIQKNAERGAYGLRILRSEQCDEAILRRVLARTSPAALNHERLCALTALCRRTRGKIEIGDGFFAEKTPSALYFSRSDAHYPAPVPLKFGANPFGEWGEMTVSVSAKEIIRDDPFRQALDASALEGAALRTRRDGDRFRPLGCGDRLLSDVLIDRRIDRPLRDCVPLVTKGNRVLWCVGVGISEDAKLRPETNQAVLLEWHEYKSPKIQ